MPKSTSMMTEEEEEERWEINPAIKRHLELEIKTLQNAPRDADKLKKESQLTLTVPTMFGWSIQKYGTSPASVKVYSNVACGAIIGESNSPLCVGLFPELTVCACESLFVHVTVLPTLT